MRLTKRSSTMGVSVLRFFHFIAAILALSFSASVAAKAPTSDYAGDDGGYLVYSVGTIRIGMDFGFPYRRIAAPDGSTVDDSKGEIEPKLGGAFTLKIKKPDFTGVETGHVVARRLPPGRYIIENFAFGGQSPVGGSVLWSSEKPFRIEFVLLPGQTTYIGSFMRSPSFGTPLQAQLGAAGFFVVSDQSARDLPIARARVAGLPPVTGQVTDVDTLGSLALRSRLPE